MTGVLRALPMTSVGDAVNVVVPIGRGNSDPARRSLPFYAHSASGSTTATLFNREFLASKAYRHPIGSIPVALTRAAYGVLTEAECHHHFIRKLVH